MKNTPYLNGAIDQVELEAALLSPRIGILTSDSGVTIFEPGDESTPEWIAMHPPPDPIADAKAAKRSEIEADKERECHADVQALGHTWQADDYSQLLLNKAVSSYSIGVPLPPAWRSKDNVNVPITGIETLAAIIRGIAVNTNAAFVRMWTRKAALDAATTLQELDEV